MCLAVCAIRRVRSFVRKQNGMNVAAALAMSGWQIKNQQDDTHTQKIPTPSK